MAGDRSRWQEELGKFATDSPVSSAANWRMTEDEKTVLDLNLICTLTNSFKHCIVVIVWFAQHWGIDTTMLPGYIGAVTHADASGRHREGHVEWLTTSRCNTTSSVSFNSLCLSVVCINVRNGELKLNVMTPAKLFSLIRWSLLKVRRYWHNHAAGPMS